MRSRLSWLAVAWSLLVVLAARLIYLSTSYYLLHSPRYRLESAAIAFVIVGVGCVVSRPGGSPGGVAERYSIRWFWLPVFIAGSIALYYPALSLGMLSDDYVLRAAAMSPTLNIGSGWFVRPLPLLLWRVVTDLGGSDAAFHALNLALHGLNALLLVGLGTTLGMRRQAAVGAGALFLAFPALPEAVAWSSGIQDILMATFGLCAVLFALRAPTPVVRVAGACLAFAAGLAAKETAICIPVLIVICLGIPKRSDAPLYGALAAVLCVYGVLRVMAGISAAYFVTPSRYFIKQLLVVSFGTLVTPWRTAASSAPALAGPAVVSGFTLLLTFAFFAWRRDDADFRRAARLALWVCAAVAPVFSYFFISSTLEGSRYLYLPACGWALLVANLIWSVAGTKAWATPLAATLTLVLLAGSTLLLRGELRVWHRASQLRDVVLAEARRSVAAADCGDVAFLDAPDSVEGAYVFRNGLREAVGRGQGQTKPAGATCELQWNGERFVRQP